MLNNGTKLGPYEILSPLGVGGMGEVYRAKDTRLGREVAIKVLPEKLADNPDALARFEREAKAIAALSHPNILAIFDIGNEEGVAFVVTELLEGETLRQHIRGSAVPWRKAIDYGSAIADGLAAAHAKGVIHRDLKPENIFLTSDGGVKILDFGLARMEPGVGGEAGSGDLVTKTLDTKPGTILGTLNYMSPEQVRGKKTDARSDIFALGCVLHEMVSGQKTFSGETAADTMTAILKDEPVSVIDSCSDAGPELDRVISRCLEKKPEQRFHSATDLAFTLRGILNSTSVFKPPPEAERRRIPTMVKFSGALVLSVALIFAGWYVPQWLNIPATAPPVDVGKIRSLAVLPFENISRDPDTDYLSNEIPANIIDKLSGLSDLSVISRSGAFRFDPAKEDASSFGKSLGASVVLTGQLNARGNNLTIRAELVDVATNQQLWSRRYPRELTDIMAVEADITQNISEALRLELTQQERTELAKHYTKNAEAYRSVLQGRHWFQKFTVAGWRKALGHFQDAVRIDPKYAVAYAELSKVYGALGVWFGDMPPDEAGPKAKQAAATAIALDDTLGEAHGALAFNRLFYDWDWSGAEEEFLRSISLAPESGEAHLPYGILLRVTGRLRETEEVIKVAQQLDPTLPMNFAELGATYAYMGRYEEGIEQCRKALDLDPQFPPAYEALGYLYLARGMYDEAISHFEKNSSLRNRQTDDLGALGSAYALAGKRAKALGVLNELRGISSKGRGQVAAAKVHACLGNVEAAFASLEQAFRQRESGLLWLNTDLQFALLRGDPRFNDLLQRMGLEPAKSISLPSVKPPPDPKPDEKIRLAVLPFEGLSADTDTNYLKEEIPASIIQSLSRLSDLQVIPRSTAFRYDVGSKDTATIGRDLGATAVLTGQINARGDGLTIRAELIDVATNRQLWDERYNRKSADIIEVEEDIARNISDALRLELTGEEQRTLAKRDTENAEAYRKYLEGVFWWNKRSEQGFTRAIKLFEEAIALDSSYALAYAGQAETYVMMGTYTRPQGEMMLLAKAAAEQAIALDPGLAAPYASLGWIYGFHEWDWDKAEAAFRKAIELNPRYATGRHWYADLLLVLGRFDEAQREMDQAVALDPGSTIINRDYGIPALLRRDFDVARQRFAHALEMDPGFAATHQSLGVLYLAQRNFDEAIASFRKVRELAGHTQYYLGNLGYAYGLAGRRAEALEELRLHEDIAKRSYVPARAFALIHAGLSNLDLAFEYFNQACDQHDILLSFMKFAPEFDPLRHDPRFDALIERLNLPADPPAPVVEPWQEIKTRLAVLPFDNRSGDPEARYLADEIPASIIDSLSMLPRLQVVPRSTAFRHRDRSDDVAAVGGLLNAYAVLTGQINTHGKELRIRAELIEVATNRQLWSQRYDQSLADTMAVETEITARIAEALQLQFGVTELARLKQRCPVNSEAHCKYLEGRYWWGKRSRAAVRKSIELFEQALGIDPQYALAHAGLADSYCTLGWAYDRPSDMFPKARQAAERALAIDPDLAEAYPAIGFVRLAYDRDPAGAKQVFDKALALNPSYAHAHHWNTLYVMWTGRTDETLASTRRAQKLDPGSLMINWSVGMALYVRRDYAAAAEQLQRTLEMDTDFRPALQMLGMVYLRMERYDEAVEIYHRLYAGGDPVPISAGKLGLIYGVAGRRAEALEELRILEELAKERYMPPTAFALIHAGLGDMDEAFRWMDRAIKERDCYMVLVRASPTFDELRADPRFDDLLRRIGTEP